MIRTPFLASTMMHLSMWSVPHRDGRVFAIVPDSDEYPYRPEARLRADDPLWASRDLKFHWAHFVDIRKCRCRPRNKIIFWQGVGVA